MAGSDSLDALRDQLAHAVIGVDYDGTLAPIVNDPALAAPLSAARDALGALVGRAQLVVVVSGRPVEFLREQLDIDGVMLIGQYGLARLVVDEVVIDERARPYLAGVAMATAAAEQQWPELLIERKGELAVTVHWRTAAVQPPESQLRALAQTHGLAMLAGRKSCEFRPPVPVDKGSAFSDVVHDFAPRAALFAGDDRGDLAVFDALDDLTAAHSLDHAVRVGVRSDEAPAEILERADVLVDGPSGVAELFSSLVRP